MKYCVYHNPVPLSRPRFGQGRVYDPQKNERIFYTIAIERQHNNRPMLTGPLHLDVTFFMPMPPSMSLKKKSQVKDTPHFVRPDLSNLLKWLEDVAQQAGLFKDDSCIVSVAAHKIYSDEPRTEFIFTPLQGERHGKKEKV